MIHYYRRCHVPIPCITSTGLLNEGGARTLKWPSKTGKIFSGRFLTFLCLYRRDSPPAVEILSGPQHETLPVVKWGGRLSNRKIKVYYRKLKKDEEVLHEARTIVNEPGSIQDVELDTGEDEPETTKKRLCKPRINLSVSAAARLTLSANILLFFLKLGAAIQSGSLSVISSLIDSAFDLFSGLVIAVTSYLIDHYDPHHYPVGRNRLEPVAIIITASVMSTATLQIIITSIQDIASNTADPTINFFSGSIIVLTILLKTVLYLLCCQVDNASVQLLATDHRNDVASNMAALVFGLLGTYTWKNIDPIGAIILSFYIIYNWVSVGREQLKNLVGHRANRRFISKLIYIAKEHNPQIKQVDTVRAYTFGIYYLVEVHVVLPSEMPLHKAHDIGESLQQKLEKLREVERAFVHCDFESEHHPSIEHKLPSHV